MIKKVAFSVIALVVGALMFVSGFRHWRDDPMREYVAVDGTVLDHQVTLNKQRWQSDELEAMELATSVRLPDHGSVAQEPVVIREYVSLGKDAWDLAASAPSGAVVPFLISPDRKNGMRSAHVSHGPVVAMIIGMVIMLMALAIQLPVWSGAHRASVIASLFCLAFLVGGVVSAWSMWPDVVDHVRAASWDLTPCETLGRRRVGSGKSTRHELAVRYTVGDRTYENVLGNPSFGLQERIQNARFCRVNPAQPWQVALSWGWRPGLGVALFPVPFLCVGLLGLAIPFSSVLRTQIKVGDSHAPPPAWRDWERVSGSLLVLLFVGSIVGVFVSLCAEMWIHKDVMRWILTPFLVPFVWQTLKLAKAFFSNIGKAVNARMAQ